jgi:hypothetical protein
MKSLRKLDVSVGPLAARLQTLWQCQTGMPEPGSNPGSYSYAARKATTNSSLLEQITGL